MDLLIAEPLEADVLEWLDARHEIFYAPKLAQDATLLREALPQARALLLPPQVPFDAGALASSARLQAIGRIVGGAENIDLTACQRAGVEVVRSLDAAAPAEAEFVIGALLTLLRPSPADNGRVAGRELGRCTVGLVGLSPAAHPLARLLRTLGSRVLGYDPGLHASDSQWQRSGIQPLGLREVFEQSDAVVVLLPYYSRYHGLLGERTLGQARRGQILVSLSALEIFDNAVLAEALSSRRITAAWLDQAGPGSIETGQPLHGLPGVLVTPRMASYTREARLRSAWGVARRIDEILRSQPARLRQGALRREGARPAPTAADPLMGLGVLPESQPGRLSNPIRSGRRASDPPASRHPARINPAG